MRSLFTAFPMTSFCKHIHFASWLYPAHTFAHGLACTIISKWSTIPYAAIQPYKQSQPWTTATTMQTHVRT
jgi:hypothetical protein